MHCNFRSTIFWITVLALLGVAWSPAQADTILKLDSGGDSAFDVNFNGSTLVTKVDSNGVSPGNQDTAVDFLGFLSGETDLTAAQASFTIAGITPVGGPTSTFGVFFQQFEDGTISLWNGNNLLAEIELGTSTLVGTGSGSATGALFSTSFGTVTDGSLQPQIKANTVSFSMSFTNINGGAGLSIVQELLAPFMADVTLNFAADEVVPEPTSCALVLIGGFLALGWTTSRRAKNR